jgi:hypothetical protein
MMGAVSKKKMADGGDEMPALISARHIEEAASQGRREISFDRGAIVTPAARDRARELGIEIKTILAGPAATDAARAPQPVAEMDEELGWGPGHPTYFENVLIDNLLNIVLELGAALWVVKDRVRLLEDVFVEHGILLPDTLEKHETPLERQRELKDQRDEFVERLYQSLRYTGR